MILSRVSSQTPTNHRLLDIQCILQPGSHVTKFSPKSIGPRLHYADHMNFTPTVMTQTSGDTHLNVFSGSMHE